MKGLFIDADLDFFSPSFHCHRLIAMTGKAVGGGLRPQGRGSGKEENGQNGKEQNE
jgi:hypothetical protein